MKSCLFAGARGAPLAAASVYSAGGPARASHRCVRSAHSIHSRNTLGPCHDRVRWVIQ